MARLNRVDARADEVVVGRYDGGDGQLCHGRAGRGRRDALAERDRTGRARGRELDDADVVCRGDVEVEPPPQAFVELLGSLDVGYGDDVDLKVHHVDLANAIPRPGFDAQLRLQRRRVDIAV